MSTVFLASLAAIVGPIAERRRRELLASALRPCDGELSPYCPERVVAASRR